MSGAVAAQERKDQPQAAAEEKQKKNKRKRKEVAPFGNYRNYYGYRVRNLSANLH